MKTFTRWALRTAALWVIGRALDSANAALKQRQRERKLRQQAAGAAALPRTMARKHDPSVH